MAKKDDVPADEKTTAIVNWEEKLAGYAEEAAAEEAVQGNFLSVRAGQLAIDKTPCAGNVLDCVVIAHAYENAYYAGKYDPNNPKPPACYAIAVAEDEMRPHAKAPQKQADSCSVCPKNEWGSDPAGGRGKACKNIRRLALLPQDALDSADKVGKADVLHLKLPVMSVRNWSKYVNDVKAEVARPPFAVSTQIGTTPDAKSQFKVTFKLNFKVSEPEVLQALVGRHEREKEAIDFPYPAETTTAEVADSTKM